MAATDTAGVSGIEVQHQQASGSQCTERHDYCNINILETLSAQQATSGTAIFDLEPKNRSLNKLNSKNEQALIPHTFNLQSELHLLLLLCEIDRRPDVEPGDVMIMTRH